MRAGEVINVELDGGLDLLAPLVRDHLSHRRTLRGRTRINR